MAATITKQQRGALQAQILDRLLDVRAQAHEKILNRVRDHGLKVDSLDRAGVTSRALAAHAEVGTDLPESAGIQLRIRWVRQELQKALKNGRVDVREPRGLWIALDRELDRELAQASKLRAVRIVQDNVSEAIAQLSLLGNAMHGQEEALEAGEDGEVVFQASTFEDPTEEPGAGDWDAWDLAKLLQSLANAATSISGADRRLNK